MFCTATYIMIPDGQYDKLKSINHYAKSDTIHADFFVENCRNEEIQNLSTSGA